MAHRSSSRTRRPLLAAACLLALGAPACGHPAGKDAEEMTSDAVPTIAGETVAVARRDLIEPLLVRGAVTALPNADVRLAPLVGGRVTSMRVAEGDPVRAGQVLATIDAQPLVDQRRQARAGRSEAAARLENADLDLARVSRLFDRGIAAGKEVEDARAARAAAAAGLEQAEAALSMAERQLDRAQIRSPIDGHVLRRFVGVGEQVDGSASQPVVEVANVEAVEIAAHVAADRLARVVVGQQATVRTEAAPDRTFEGAVVAVTPAVDPGTNSALVRIRVANPDRVLKVGMFAEARLTLARRAAALAVPPAAISRGDDGTAVYVVNGDDAVRTPVTLGLETPGAVEVLTGLAEGQRVLVSNLSGLGARAHLTARP